MNILCLEQFSRLGGGQLSLLSLLPGLKARGWRPVIAMPNEGPLADLARKSGLEIEVLNAASYANGHKTLFDVTRFAYEYPKLIWAIGRLLSTHRIDLLYVNAPRILPSAAIAARIYSVPLVFHCHNRIVQWSGVVAIGESLRLSGAHVIACCKYAAAPILRYVNPERFSVLYNGVGEVSSHVPARRAPLHHIGVIGRIEPEKGQMDFVRAARAVLNRFPDCRFSVIGAPLFSSSKYLDQVVGASRELPVHFLGWQDDISSVLAGLDLLVVPSGPLDSAPRVIFEAFAAGVPVVAFPSGGIPEIVKDGETGFLTAETTSDALAERICAILEMDSAQLQVIVTRAWERWREEYRLDIYWRRVGDFLLQAAAA
jgi:glycosyltransferase involved in cell wall biosynthesis